MSSKTDDLPIHIEAWINENGHNLKPPIGNLQFWKDRWQNLLVMMVGGPNDRPDYHDDPGEELFIQIRGDVTLKLIDPVTRQKSQVIVREGEMYLLPAHTRHSPQRPEGCVGLVIERYRQPGEVDALEWYDDDGNLEFRGEFLVKNIERDLSKVQMAWKEWRTNPNRQIPTVWRVPSSSEG
ncbi:MULTISPECIES: 3-hydroxyanthranilate 3,4-dioxygenase [unclassified Beijerinckia]|uniref:3-hydroxyanthranilate 3,4-dioxygenase n=1 Tax=unclassified Beijerinckia TaxID=2638183 RepID=UPI00089BC92B|nr:MULTISPECIES: 3-hydroxyanthranilate 3,4-dioxygenase [unclassified Beijerinckia]MDH7797741.1 3-hydroxyanthranilate 3,4-dioxygenase [Beijerinckia sp. GAS462]SEC97044.1 3-hydroxyanthranilate 3,4-dioxygenase [Beijerinckia sp. 28-YEA-48]